MINNIWEHVDLKFNFKRDGAGNGHAVVFVMGDEVVHGGTFNLIFSKRVFRDDSIFSSENEMILGEEKEVITAINPEYTTKFIVDEMLTALLLSNPKIIRLSFPKDRKVMPQWKYDGESFYIYQEIDGVQKKINGEGEIVDE